MTLRFRLLQPFATITVCFVLNRQLQRLDKIGAVKMAGERVYWDAPLNSRISLMLQFCN